MALDMGFATQPLDPNAGVLTAAPPPAAPVPAQGVLQVQPDPAPAAPAGGGVLGFLGGLAKLPGGYVNALGSEYQDIAAQHQMNQQMAQAKYAQFKAQMAGLQEVREGISDPKEIALFDADPFAYAKSAGSILEATRTPVKMAGGESLGTPAGGISTTAPLLGVTKDGVGYSQTPAATIMNGSLPTVQDVAPGHIVSGLPPLGAPANGVNGGFAGIPNTPAPPAGDVPTDPSAAPNVTGGISQTWAARALTPQARAIAAQIASHPAIASLPAQDQANILTTGFNESRFDPTATNGSSAHLFQFQPAAWKQFGGGADPSDVNAQIAAEAKMYAFNKGVLTKALGRAPTGAELYMTAMQGPGGGPALLTAAPGVNAVTALRNAGVSSGIALASIAGNLPGYNYHTAEGRQAANSAAMKMTAQQFTSIWANHFNQNQAHIFGGAPAGNAPAPTAPQAGNVWANGNTDAPGGPTRSVSGQPVPPPPAAPTGNGYPSISNQGGDTILTAAQVPNGQPGFTYKRAVDGSLTPIPPAVTETDFNGLGNQYVGGDIHKRAGQIVGDLSTLATSLATLPPGALQSQQATNAALSSMTRANTIRPVTIEKFEESQGLGEEANALISRTFGDRGQTITPAMLQQMYRMTHIAAKQATDQDAATLAPIIATAKKYGYDASNYTGQHPTLPTVPAAMQDAIPAPAQRKVGATYWGPRGPGVWTGKGWKLQ